MIDGKDISNGRVFRRVTRQGRVRGLIVLGVMVGIAGCAGVVAAGWVDMGRILGPCGFQQRFELPCFSCGMTRSVVAFMQGRIWDSFYMQPAGGVLCCVVAVVLFLAFIAAVFGLYFRFIDRVFREIKVGYWILAVFIIVAGGWAVTLARALAARQ